MMSEHLRGINREQPGKWTSLLLTVAVHVGLIAFLVFGISWQSAPPGSMEVELVAPAPSLPPPPVARPAPPPEPKPEPKPQPRPEPKPVPPKPAPEPPKPAPKPDIATKAPEKKPEPKKPEPPKPEPPKPEPKKPEPKPEPKPQPKPEPKPTPKPEPKPVEPPRDDYLAERLAEETNRAQMDRMMRDDAARRAAASNRAAGDAYQNAIRTKVRGNLIRPPGLQGNPEAVFVVDQLPDGTVVNVKLTRSSGIPTLDDAIERAIRRSSPLPLPASQELFQRTLELKFRPLEE